MPAPLAPASRPISRKAGGGQRRLTVERLEQRLLMTASPSDPFAELLSHGGVCGCPICSGQGIEAIAAEQATGTPNASLSRAMAGTPTGLPSLSSRSGAAATLFLDFNGHLESRWGEYTSVYTPAYDIDGNYSSFSAAEVAAIREIWARVAEDYAPFNINVTTVAPPVIADGVSARIAIGGNYSDWFGSSAGGVAYVGGFTNGASNVGYVFEDALANGNVRYVAEAATHEAGHLFGLMHQAKWSGNQLVEEYHSGTGDWAPIMGVGYYADRTTWHSGSTSSGASSYQDDLSILAGANNGFGYVPDDYGSTTGAATPLPISGSSVNVSGLIGRAGDRDVFKFNTSGGRVNFRLDVAPDGANLDGVLELLNAAGQAIQTINPSGSLGASLATTLAAGTYYVAVRASGGYGNLGQYNLTGSVTAGTVTSPEIGVSVGGAAISDGGAVSFGSTTVGKSVMRTITITNTGSGTLTLNPLSATSLPSGYSLLTNIGRTSLSAGQSTSFTVRMNGAQAGTFAGGLVLRSSDANEGTYNLALNGTVHAAQQQTSTRILDNGGTGFSGAGAWKRVVGGGRERDMHWEYGGSGNALATWTFTGLTSGQYRVSATWPGSRMNATNAPFSISSGSQSLGSVAVNQQRASSTFSDSGSMWQNLGTFTISGNSLTVRLSNRANGRVIADAIRIERVYSTSGGTAFQNRALVPEEAAALGYALSEPSADPDRHERPRDALFAASDASPFWRETLDWHLEFARTGSWQAYGEDLEEPQLSGDAADGAALDLLADLALASLLSDLHAAT